MPARILYIDDDPALARLAQRILGRYDYSVTHAASVAAGIEAFMADTYDAVVLDHYFQDKTGLHFLEEIGCKSTLVPILYVTGSSDAQIAINALKGGAADYVIKTVTDDFFPLLASAIDQALNNARLRREKDEADRLLIVAKERAELMVAEMNHRVANSLSLVSAMIRLQANTVISDEAKNALQETQSRIAAIAGVHRSLYTSENVGAVALDVYLGALIDDLQRTGGASSDIIVTTDLRAVFVTADQAVALGVIVTELVSNALKYAYPEGKGQIGVTLRQTEDNQLQLRVDDDGIGFNPSEAPKGTGLGTKLIKAMCKTLDATLDYDESAPGGHVRLTWAVPVVI
ncbi:histidine kinase dimerization/phosphoacceptor domain -containing protein [Agrobacterium sp.]|uniref:histidine kinase dimerization/phosphoacceptor domain -containing protein n=1 Tax=Agrobacterium sp. TaxID=361 RepID=UPI0028ADC806